MNLAIHQYRVTPLRSSTELHLGVGHGTRHDLFLPSLFPLRHPTRKVVSGGELLSSAVVPRKVRMLKTASPGRFVRVPLSASRSLFRASPCRCAEKYTRIIAARQAHFSKILYFFATIFQKY